MIPKSILPLNLTPRSQNGYRYFSFSTVSNHRLSSHNYYPPQPPNRFQFRKTTSSTPSSSSSPHHQKPTYRHQWVLPRTTLHNLSIPLFLSTRPPQSNLFQRPLEPDQTSPRLSSISPSVSASVNQAALITTFHPIHPTTFPLQYQLNQNIKKTRQIGSIYIRVLLNDRLRIYQIQSLQTWPFCFTLSSL